MARVLGLSQGTVRAISSVVYARFGVHRRLDLMDCLAELGVITDPDDGVDSDVDPGEKC